MLVVGSLAYLYLESARGGWFSWLIDKWTRPTNLLAAPYATALALLMTRQLPRTSEQVTLRLMGYASVASFHIFLVRMVWFAFRRNRDPASFIVALVACFALGMTFCWLEKQLARRG